jgi:chitinase
MDALGYDGLDVDWEPLYDADKPQVLQFLKDLRAARPGVLLTFPIGWANANWGADPWYAQVAPLVDQLNVMSYEMADNWGGWTSWHSAALHGEGGSHPSSIASTARAYLATGIPAAKLGIGLGFYGSCWRGVSAMGVPLDGTAARVAASDNVMSYATIVSQYYTPGAYRWDATARMGYLSFAAPTGPAQCTMVSYEDPQSVTEKGAFVRAQGLGGAIVWTINQGHLPTAPAGQRDPLLRAAYTAISP